MPAVQTSTHRSYIYHAGELTNGFFSLIYITSLTYTNIVVYAFIERVCSMHVVHLHLVATRD